MQKVYTLLEHMRPDVPIYQHVGNGQRVKYSKMPDYRPDLQITFTGEDGKNKTIRFKENSNTIDFHDQVKNENIPANEKFTQRERDLLNFKNGFLISDNPLVQEYIEAYPAIEGFKGRCSDPRMKVAVYKIYDPKKEEIELNGLWNLQLDAALKIRSMDEDSLQGLYIRVTSDMFNVPKDKVSLQNAMIAIVDNADEDGLKEILREDNFDDEINILIGKSVTNGVLSFTEIPDAIAIKTKGGQWTSVKEIPSSYPMIERRRHFAAFLTSKDGAILLDSIKKELGGGEGLVAKSEKKSSTSKPEK